MSKGTVTAGYRPMPMVMQPIQPMPGDIDAAANGNLIIAGTSLKVPGSGGGSGSGAGGARTHLVVRGDTLSGIAARYGVAQASIARTTWLIDVVRCCIIDLRP